MPRKRIQKTQRGEVSTETYVVACKKILESKETIRSVAKSFNLSRTTLRQYLIRFKNGENLDAGYHPHNKVFTAEQESLLVNYCITSAKLYYGVTTIDLRRLAYEFAVKNNIKYPTSWDCNKQAGSDWCTDMMKRHPKISIRVPEATSLSRAMNFNKPNVDKFFANLNDVRERYQSTPENIRNLDESALTTAQKPVSIIAERGTKQVGSITSHERGELVTICLAVNAIGNLVPPFFVFPRKNFKGYFLRGGPAGCVGSANQSGWMQEGDFLLYLKHFVQHTKPSERNRVLVVLDNHSSHISISAINYCRENFITPLSFPPHTSHKLQPLDRTVFGPFKHRFNAESDRWSRDHPGVRMTIYDIPAITAAAFSSVKSANITAGFKCTGIYPFNPTIFSDEEFAPATVTDMPQNAIPDQPVELLGNNSDHSNNCILIDKTNDQQVIIHAPSEICPLRKAQLSNKNKKSRLRGKTAIYTDTPEKLEIEARNKNKKRPNKLNLTVKQKKKRI